jgi:hypothetical protein
MSKIDEKTMRGYKGFDMNLQCRGFQYEVGRTYASDRFALFDRDGDELNEAQLEDLQEEGADVLGLRVLETKESDCEGYGIEFPVTHIRLPLKVGKEFGGERLLSGGELRFGERDTTRP